MLRRWGPLAAPPPHTHTLLRTLPPPQKLSKLSKGGRAWKESLHSPSGERVSPKYWWEIEAEREN